MITLGPLSLPTAARASEASVTPPGKASARGALKAPGAPKTRRQAGVLDVRDHAVLAAVRSGTLPIHKALDALDELVRSGKLTPKEALLEVKAELLPELLLPSFDDESGAPPAGNGLGVSPGCASGVVIFDPDEAERRAAEGEKVILVIKQVTPEQVPAMKAVAGVICALGGETSHTAVVARDFGIPAVNNELEFSIDRRAKTATLGGLTVREGDRVSIDGRQGLVYAGERSVQILADRPSFKHVLEWAKGLQGTGVWANADLPGQAERAFGFGAAGVGLVRTEHMFFGERLRVLQAALLALDDYERAPFLEQLAEWQRSDFEGIFRAARGRPVSIRLLDPPRHEFMPELNSGDCVLYLEALAEALGVGKERLEEAFRTIFGDYSTSDVARLFVRVHEDSEEQIELGKALGGISAGEVRNAIAALGEHNPMMGARGVRLGVQAPDLYDMQVESIFRAAAACQRGGVTSAVRITLPMIGLGIDPSREGAEVAELAAFRPRIEELKRQVEEETGATLTYELGAMIETPAAALNADLVAQHADYFSYGTNDLTQLTLGVDRENTTLLASYRDAGLLTESPFKRIDPTVAKLVEVSLSTGRAVKRELSGGVCGEQAADPESLSRLSRAGVSYVSVSPYRVPTALVVSAQDKIRAELAVDAAVIK